MGCKHAKLLSLHRKAIAANETVGGDVQDVEDVAEQDMLHCTCNGAYAGANTVWCTDCQKQYHCECVGYVATEVPYTCDDCKLFSMHSLYPELGFKKPALAGATEEVLLLRSRSVFFFSGFGQNGITSLIRLLEKNHYQFDTILETFFWDEIWLETFGEKIVANQVSHDTNVAHHNWWSLVVISMIGYRLTSLIG